MKRILTLSLCLIMLLGTAQAAEYFYINRKGSPYFHADKNCSGLNRGLLTWVESYTIAEIPYPDLASCPICTAPDLYYYVNPDGGQFYHSERHCPAVSCEDWDRLMNVSENRLLEAPYDTLSPCPFCTASPILEAAYYVNPDGGQFYHSERHCPSMSSKYWDQLLSVTETMLSEAPYDSLSPCPFCTVSAVEEAAYYVNPNGGQFYHEEPHCPSMSSKYWDQQIVVTESMLSEAPYDGLSPCPFCTSLSEKAFFSDPWISQFDTASSVELTGPGVYQAGSDMKWGLYTVRTTGQASGDVVATMIDGTVINTFAIQGEANYSLYLWDGMSIALPEYATLTPIVKRSPGQQAPAQETIRQTRRMLYYEMPEGVYTAEAIDGQEGFLVFSPIMADAGQDVSTTIALSPGETVVFDTCMDGQNDPLPLKYFASPSGRAYFIEFVNCIVRPVGSDI